MGAPLDDTARARVAADPGRIEGLAPEHNIRELGGLRAHGGRVVRHGLLYRGKAISGLEPSELALIDRMNLELVFDLRSRFEADYEPDQVPEGARYIRMAGMCWDDGEEVDFSPAGIDRMFREFPGLLDPNEGLNRLYSSMLHDVPAFHAVMREFTAAAGPLYVHCTAGKDRTGMAVALMLMALGASRETIMGNYLLTNDYRARTIEHAAATAPPEHRELMRAASGVQEHILGGALDSIAEEYPSFEDYLSDEFGLSAADLDDVRSIYLADAAGDKS
jgi:protein-tyrosine phosphatase